MENVINLTGEKAAVEQPADGFASRPTPEEQAALDVFYSPPAPKDPYDIGLRHAIRTSEGDLSLVGVPAEERQKLQADTTQALRESALDPHVLSPAIYERAAQARIAEARGTVDEAALAQRIQAGNETIRQQLSATYGSMARAEEKIRLTDLYVKQQSPKLYALLGKGGLGSDPAIVLPIVEHVHRINWKG